MKLLIRLFISYFGSSKGKAALTGEQSKKVEYWVLPGVGRHCNEKVESRNLSKV